MKIKETKIYPFSELSDEAKETAIEKYRENCTEYFWADDGINSLKEFCKQFDIELKDWGLDCGGCGQSHIYFNADTYDLQAEDVEGWRAYKYIINNYWDILYKPQFRGTIKNDTIKHRRITHEKLSNGRMFNAYHSGIFKDTCCNLTGYCLDNEIMQPIYDFLKNPNTSTTLKDLYDDCFNAFITGWNDDVESQNSDEVIIETIEANEYEFTEDGQLA
jgi:hypothetical protein